MESDNPGDIPVRGKKALLGMILVLLGALKSIFLMIQVHN